MPLLLLTVPIISTLIGGMMAVRFRRYISLLIAIGAGLLLGAAFLDLLPEALSLGLKSGLSHTDVLGLTLLAFLLFHVLDGLLDYLSNFRRFAPRAKQQIVRRTGAGLLIFHSFRDGMAIGAAYAASHSAGYAVALGIAAHDLGDGMNTVLLTTAGKTPTRTDYAFLAADALAPFLGGLLTIWLVLSSNLSVGLLALAAGFFLQLATGDFLPEVRHAKGPRRFLLPSVLFGASVIYLANRIIVQHH